MDPGLSEGARKGRSDFEAKYADAAFTLHSTLEAGQSYYTDVKQQAASYGRDPNQLKVFPAATLGSNVSRYNSCALPLVQMKPSPNWPAYFAITGPAAAM